jgi:hypothetical protein
MTHAVFVKRARKPIYVTGKQVTYKGADGSKRAGLTMSKLDRTVPANDRDQIMIDVGDSYYWWAFKNGPKQYSINKPRRSQLTRSEFLSGLYELEDEIAEYELKDIQVEETTEDTLQTDMDEWVSRIEELRDGCQDRLDNMPEGLQESSDSGMLLQERIDGLNDWITDLGAVDLSIDDNEDFKEQVVEEWGAMTDYDKANEEESEWLTARFIELKREAIDDIISNIQSTSSGL